MNEAIQALVKKVQQTGGEKPKPASGEDLKRAEEPGFPSEPLNSIGSVNPQTA